MAFTEVQDYLDLITSEHQGQPKYAAFLSIFLQGQVDLMNLYSTMPGLFDIDLAVGAQLDAIGVRVGQSRLIPVPLTNVYFAWDTDFLGWDQGVWQGPFDPDTGMLMLSDEAYRKLLKAVIASNQWDGTSPGAYAVWAAAFGEGMIQLKDNQNMTIDVTWVGPEPDAVTIALLQSGNFLLKPAGVDVNQIFLRQRDGTLRQLK